MEVLTWLTVAMLSFCFINVYLRKRTAASIVAALWIATFATLGLFGGILGEASLSFAIGLTLLYGLSRAIRDGRDDPSIEEKERHHDIHNDTSTHPSEDHVSANGEARTYW
jgi:hypothetical protein